MKWFLGFGVLGLLCLVSPLTMYAGVTFTGKVVDREEEFPLAGVLIYVRGPGIQVYSDGVGEFSIELEQGTYEFVLVYPGYRRLIAETRIFPEETETVIFRMVEDESYIPTEAEVTAERIKHAVSRTTLTQEEMQTIPAGAGDIVRQFIGSIPGVAIPAAGLGVAAFVVRGGEPEDNVIYFDNIPILSIFHFGGLVSVFNSALIRNIDFYAGGFPPGFGHYIGSVMDLKSKRRAEKKISGKFNVNMVTSDFFIQGPIGEKVYFMASARRSYYDLIIPRIFPIELEIFPFFWDIYAKISVDPNQDHKIDLFFIGSEDKAEVDVDRELTDEDLLVGEGKVDSNFYSVGMNWKYVPSDNWYNESTFGWLRYDVFLQAGEDPISRTPFYLSIKQNRFTLRNTTSILLTEDLELAFGPFISYAYVPFEMNAPRIPLGGGGIPSSIDDLGPTERTEDLFQSINLNAWARFTWELDDLKLIFGPEFNWLNLTNYFSFSPRVAVEWKFLPTWMLMGAFGIYFQSPTDLELQGYSELKDKMSFHYILGATKELTDTTELKVETYFKHSHNLIEFERTDIIRDPTTGEILEVQNIYNNEQRAYAYGVELFLKQNLWHNFYGWISYTFSKALYKESDDAAYHVSPYDQTHMLTLIFSYEVRKWLKFSGKWRLNSGEPYTTVVGRQRISPQTTDMPDYEAVRNDELYTGRLPLWHQLDLRVDFIFSALGGNWSIYIEAINAYWFEPVTGYDYGSNFHRWDDPRPNRGGLPILPYLGIEYQF